MNTTTIPAARRGTWIIPTLGVTSLVLLALFRTQIGLGFLTSVVWTLVAIGFCFLEDGKHGLQRIGLTKANFNRKALLIWAPLAALVLCVVFIVVLLPVAERITGVPLDVSTFAALEGNLANLLITLPLVWVSAAFGEEVVFRGYLVTRLQRLLGDGKIALVVSLVLPAVLFGFVHSYQGLSGQLLTGTIGFIFALSYQYRKQNLWFTIMMHGVFDTLLLVNFYLSGISNL